jgi:protein TonB
MKRFTFLLAVLFLFFGSNFSLFGQTQNEKEEIIEVESDCGLDENIEIIIEDIEPIEDVEIEMCRFVTDVTAIEAPKEDMIYTITEQNAVFEGGWKYFFEIGSNQIRFSETMKEGRVFIEFVVDTTGKMTNFKVRKNLSEENDKEALRVVNLINEYYTWKPAEQRGKKVKVKMCFPIVFKRKEEIKSNSERVYVH